jgi:hypothetical protein
LVRIGDRYYLDKEQEKVEGRPNLDMELETKDSKTELPKFSPGETIKGRLKMENIEQTFYYIKESTSPRSILYVLPLVSLGMSCHLPSPIVVVINDRRMW